MFNDGGSNNSSKRKMKEVATTSDQPTPSSTPMELFNLQPQRPISPVRPQSSTVQRILNAAAPATKPFSFTHLLNAVDLDEDVYRQFYIDDMRNKSEQIDRAVTSHGENLTNELTGLWENHHREAEERATRKLKEQEASLQASRTRIAELEMTVETLKQRLRCSERTTMVLRNALSEANAAARRQVGTEAEDAESSYVDTERVAPVRTDCRICERGVATVMLWPCRHICVCAQCNRATAICPVCRVAKTIGVECVWPPN